MNHTVRGFSIVNEAEVFLELFCFFNDPIDVGNLISGSSAFSKSSLNIWKLLVHILLKPSLDNFERYLDSMWNRCNFVLVWAFSGISLLWDWNENWLFSVLRPLLSFSNFRHIECSTFTAPYFRIWNSSAGIPSPPIALFIMMLRKVHLTSHSRMSGSRWVITPLLLSGSLKSFLYSFSLHSWHLLLIASVSVRSLSFLYFIMLIFTWNVSSISLIFLKISLVFPILLFSSISLPCPLRKVFLSLLTILWNYAFRWMYLSFSPLSFTSLLYFSLLFSSQVFVRPPQITILPFFFFGMVWITTSCTVSWISTHSSSGTLSDIIPWIYL